MILGLTCTNIGIWSTGFVNLTPSAHHTVGFGGEFWVLVLDGWLDRVWTEIQSLSTLCPSYVQPLSNKRKIQGMSRRYPGLVHSMSSLCRFSQNLDRGWTSKSKVCTGLVQPFGKTSFFLIGQTVDELLTQKNHHQGSHVDDLKT